MKSLLLILILCLQVVKAETKLEFPDNFEWCVATSAHQIEGDNRYSDWWEFERKDGSIKNDEVSGEATNHWNLLEEDIEWLTKLKVKTYRMSIEWAKVQPGENLWDEVSINHYKKEIQLLEKNNISPMITLLHFTLPNWLRKIGGWSHPGAAKYFEKFTEVVFEKIAPNAKIWITFNEPMLYILGGYVYGEVPPNKSSWDLLEKPLVGVLQAHSKAYRKLHSLASRDKKEIQVGVASHFRVISSSSRINPLSYFAAKYSSQALNWTINDAIDSGVLKLNFPFLVNIERKISDLKGTQDFVGINYYKRDFIKIVTKAPFIEIEKSKSSQKTDLGWEIYPKGLNFFVNKVAEKYKNIPIFVTENGLADKSDSTRISFINSHLKWLQKSIDQGANVLGYCHWSLMDNFEWREGFSPRFGLLEINYKTFERTPRPSFFHFSKIISSGKTKYE